MHEHSKWHLFLKKCIERAKKSESRGDVELLEERTIVKIRQLLNKMRDKQILNSDIMVASI